MNRDAPTVVRRRKIARAHREQTPEPELKNKIKYSDEERSSSPTSSTKAITRRESSESTVSSNRATTSHLTSVGKNDSNDDAIPLRASARSHINKILNRRDKILLSRSHSSPREDNLSKTNTNVNSDLHKFMRTARRSLSSPRNKEESSDNSGRFSPANKRTGDKPKIPPRKIFPTQQIEQNNQNNNNAELTKLERNLKRFDEERLRFEQEKQNFEREKKELEKLQIKRFNDIERRRFHISNKANSNKLILLPITDASLKKPQRSVSPKRKPLVIDYESSTVSCSSSEEADDDLTNSPVDEDITLEKNNDIGNGMTNGNTNNMLQLNAEEEELLFKSTFIQENNGAASHTLENTNEDSLIEIKNKKEKLSRKSLLKILLFDSYRCWNEFKNENYDKYNEICLLRNRCICDFIILTIFCGMGGIIFRFTEGAFENFYKCGVKRVKRDFIDQLWYSSHNLREDDWKELARKRLRIFEEELHVAHEAGITSYSGMKSWSFLNSVVYCITVVTTIGYGHISPATRTGQAITIIYAIFGIPIFLILLADFGKLFTRGIKFLWIYVRRLYYTGSCRKVRKNTQKDMMRGINMMYDIATFHRPSLTTVPVDDQNNANVEGSPNRESLSNPSNTPSRHTAIHVPQTPVSTHSVHLVPPNVRASTPTTPVPDMGEIDDEFNLPISLAFFILVTYIFIGATVYSIWEDWTYFESFYFVFISMSTIGFGDYVPQHPMYMMASIVYLVFGLALTSMCINVVQLKLSDSFRKASAKIGATIGLLMAEEEAARNSLQPSPTDIASVHSGININTDESPPIPPRASTNSATKIQNEKTVDKTKNGKNVNKTDKKNKK